MQRLDPLRLLPLTQLVTRRDLEERRCRFDQPLRLDRRSAMHVLLRRQHQCVKNDMLRRFAEQCATRVHVYWCALDERLVAFRWVLARRISEEARA